jgi:hypothetical protein
MAAAVAAKPGCRLAAHSSLHPLQTEVVAAAALFEQRLQEGAKVGREEMRPHRAGTGIFSVWVRADVEGRWTPSPIGVSQVQASSQYSGHLSPGGLCGQDHVHRQAVLCHAVTRPCGGFGWVVMSREGSGGSIAFHDAVSRLCSSWMAARAGSGRRRCFARRCDAPSSWREAQGEDESTLIPLVG